MTPRESDTDFNSRLPSAFLFLKKQVMLGPLSHHLYITVRAPCFIARDALLVGQFLITFGTNTVSTGTHFMLSFYGHAMSSYSLKG
jgi:hypothetical protein